jgi:hypothetical protein
MLATELGRSLALLALLASPALVGAQDRVDVKSLMGSAEFARAGLTKLSPAELAAFEQWLARYTQAVAQVLASTEKVAPSKTAPARSSELRTPEVIETCIEGEFEGWEGETIFKLCNGQIWQQSEYDYTYEYAYRPDVLIYKSASGYRMKVEDVAETIGVRRLK